MPPGRRRERAILGGRNAEAIERGRSAGQPTHQALLEQRRDLALERLTLAGEAVGLQHRIEPRAIELGHDVASPDEAAEQTVMVEVAREGVDPAPPERSRPSNRRATPHPAARVASRRRGDVVAALGAAEEAEEVVVRLERREAREL